MRKFVKAAVYTIACVLLYFILRDAFPKYSGPMKVYLVLWILDGYLWISTASYLRKRGIYSYFLFGLLYWIPFLLLVGGIVYGWFVPFTEWNIIGRTEFLTVIMLAYSVKVIPYGGRILSDLTILVFGRKRTPGVYGVKKPSMRNWLMIVSWGLGIALGVLLLAGHLIWQFRFRTEKVELTLKDLPASFDKLRIVQISDLHLGNWICKNKLDELVNRVDALKPDLIFVTGDLATFTSGDVDHFRNELAKLRAKTGIFVIYGNHDYGQYYKIHNLQEAYDNMERFDGIYRDLGWILLNNEQRTLVRGTDSLAIVGVENWGVEKRFPKLADIVKAEKGAEHVKTKLLLSHDPTYWERFIEKRRDEVDVTFSGHTHGGQIGIESPHFKYSLISLIHKYWAGLYSDTTSTGKVQYLYVNRGAGTVGYIGRIGILPEITLFILHSPGH